MALINKQKAIDEIRDFQAQVTCSFSKDWENGMEEGFDHAVGVIEMMEVVDAEPVRHGKWIHGQEVCREYIGITLVLVQYKHWECSACGYRTEKEPIWKYCPNCGAKMDAQEKDDGRKTD